MYFNRWYIIAFSIILLNTQHPLISQNNKNELNMNTKTATFGSGCFWCSEAIFSRLKGVIKVSPGFSGGHTKNPSYNDVVEGTTGHAEVAQKSISTTSYPNQNSVYLLLEALYLLLTLPYDNIPEGFEVTLLTSIFACLHGNPDK